MARNSAGSLAWMALAVLPQAVNTLSTSFLLERVHAMDLRTLHKLHKARPWLDAVSVVGLAGLAATRARVAVPALALAATFEGLSHLLTAQDAHPALDGELTILDAAAMNTRLAPDDEVLGLYVNGEARAYPLALMRVPAAVHDWLGDEPVAPTWSPMSHGAIAFIDSWQGRRLKLQAAGAPHNDLTFFDGASGGLVSQLRARILTGPNRGMPVATHPITRTTWAQWRSLHPDTTGAWFETGWKGQYLNWLLDRARAADETNEEPLYATDAIDTRLPAKTPVLAVYTGGRARAYPREWLAEHGVYEETVGATPIVIIHDPERDMAAAFVRRVGDRVANFEPAGPGRARDTETGAIYDVAGRSDKGPDLMPVPFSLDRVYWFAWAHAHPRTTVADGEAAVTISRDALTRRT